MGNRMEIKNIFWSQNSLYKRERNNEEQLWKIIKALWEKVDKLVCLSHTWNVGVAAMPEYAEGLDPEGFLQAGWKSYWYKPI